MGLTPPPPGLNNVKKKQTSWYWRASLSQVRAVYIKYDGRKCLCMWYVYVYVVGVGLVSLGMGCWYGMGPDRPSCVATGGRSCFCCKEHPFAEFWWNPLWNKCCILFQIATRKVSFSSFPCQHYTAVWRRNIKREHLNGKTLLTLFWYEQKDLREIQTSQTIIPSCQ